jgi:hypothetical protein
LQWVGSKTNLYTINIQQLARLQVGNWQLLATTTTKQQRFRVSDEKERKD